MSNYQLSVKSYPVYKDSGVEWLGDVPEHWEIKRIKEVSYINKRTLTDNTPNDYEFDYIDIGSVTYGLHGFTSERMTFNSSPSRARRIAKKGDTIISTVRTYLKAITSIDDDVSDLIVSTGFAVISPKKTVFSKYFSYWLTANYTIDEICALSTGVSYPATNASAISNLFCLVPPLNEQKLIATYLDTKTAQCDRKIDLLSKKATQYGKLKQSLINETVTRGLDKSVPMKDSGIEWIGDVPEHWEIIRIKDYTYVKGRIGWQGLRSSDFLDEGDFYCVTGTDLVNGSINWSNCYFVSEDRYEQDKYIQLRNQDLLITKDGTIGKIALINYLPLKTTLNSGLFVTRPKTKKYTNEFMYWVLNSSSFRNYIDLTKGGSTIQHLYQNVFDRFLYACPPLSEQKAIADYLDKKTAQIDQIIQTINTQIEKLKELRKTLINDVVTGKIKV